MGKHSIAQAPSFESYGGSAPENYERYFVPAIATPLAHGLVERAGLRAGERVLDLACGTGIVARLAADAVAPGGFVTGVDVNPGMLAVARSTGVAATWHEASAESLPLDTAGHDVVLCQMGLQFVGDRSAALGEAHRVLVPAGRLLLNLPGPMPDLFATLAGALAHHVSPDVARFVEAVFALHEPAVLEDMLRAAGFEGVEVTSDVCVLTLPPADQFVWQYIHSTPLSGAVGALDAAGREALGREVVESWHRSCGDGDIELELAMTTAVART